MKNQAIKIMFVSSLWILGLYRLTVYADGTTNDVLNLTGTLSSQAVINVVSNSTHYTSGTGTGGIPGLPGAALSQSIIVDIACTNGMLVELLLNSMNGLALSTSSTPSLKIPYQISIANPDLMNSNQSSDSLAAGVICSGSIIKLPINITTGNLPYGLSAGNYQDVLQLNLSY